MRHQVFLEAGDLQWPLIHAQGILLTDGEAYHPDRGRLMSNYFSLPPGRIEEAEDIRKKHNLDLFIYEPDYTVGIVAGVHVLQGALDLWELAARLGQALGKGKLNTVCFSVDPSEHPREICSDLADALRFAFGGPDLRRAEKLWDDLGGKVAVSSPAEPEPKNNDGRTACYWCTGKVAPQGSYPYVYDVCIDCGK